MTSAVPRPARGTVRVWHADTGALVQDPARVARALAWLTPPERARYDRYRFEHDRAMFLLGRVMARRLVGAALDVGPMDWEWREGPHGRPFVANPPVPLSFNIAHSAGTVACALGVETEVGVDVEDRCRPPVDLDLVRRYCSPAEVADVLATLAQSPGSTAWHERFLVYWTLKEAYLKARGLGIAVHLSDVSFSVGAGGIGIDFLESLAGTDTRWAFEIAEVQGRHILAVAASLGDSSAPRPSFIVAPLPLDLLP